MFVPRLAGVRVCVDGLEPLNCISSPASEMERDSPRAWPPVEWQKQLNENTEPLSGSTPRRPPDPSRVDPRRPPGPLQATLERPALSLSLFSTRVADE